MSYCRWSSMDFQCDLYVYESDRGIELHVASSRRIMEVPREGDPDHDWVWNLRRFKKVQGIVSIADMETINGPHDGASFTFSDEREAAYFIKNELEGHYKYPDTLIDILIEEWDERQREDSESEQSEIEDLGG